MELSVSLKAYLLMIKSLDATSIHQPHHFCLPVERINIVPKTLMHLQHQAWAKSSDQCWREKKHSFGQSYSAQHCPQQVSKSACISRVCDTIQDILLTARFGILLNDYPRHKARINHVPSLRLRLDQVTCCNWKAHLVHVCG